MAVAACTDGEQSRWLEEAEAFVPDAPDSVDARLCHISSIDDLGREERPLYALLYTFKDYMLYDTINVELGHMAYDYYLEQSEDGASTDAVSNRRFGQAALYMGEWYEAHDSLKSCEDCYRQAIRASERAEDWHTCYIACERLAVQECYSNEQEAFALMEKSIEMYGKTEDSPRNLVSLYCVTANIAADIAYQHDTDFTQALSYAAKAYQLAADSGYMNYKYVALIELAKIYWVMGDYTTALSYAKQVDVSDLNTDHGISHNIIVAQCFQSCDSLTEAKRLLQRIQHIRDNTDAYGCARMLAEIAVRQQEPDTAAFYLDSAFTCAESLFFNALEAKDDYYHQTLAHEKTQEAMRSLSRQRTQLALVVIAALLMSVMFLLQRRFYERRRSRQESQHQHRENELLNRENELLSRERELLLASVKRKDGMIRFLQGYIIDRLEVARKLQADTSKRITLSRKDWMDIERVLNEIDDNCIERVRSHYKNFSQDDLHLCMLVRLRMSNPVIGNLYGITPSAVQHRKQRLKKEGFGVSDPTRLLEDVIAGA